MRDLFEIRKALEGTAISLACERYSKEQLARLEEINERYVEAVHNRDIEQIIAMNTAFHELIYKLSNNKIIFNLIVSFRDNRILGKILHTFADKDFNALIAQHAHILEAIQQRNAREAQKRIEQHLERTKQIALQRL